MPRFQLLPLAFLLFALTLSAQPADKRFATGPLANVGFIAPNKTTTFFNEQWYTYMEQSEIEKNYEPGFGVGWWLSYRPKWRSQRWEWRTSISYQWWRKTIDYEVPLISSGSGAFEWQGFQNEQLQNIQSPVELRRYWNTSTAAVQWYTGLGYQVDWMVKRKSQGLSLFSDGSGNQDVYTNEWTTRPDERSNFSKRWEDSALLSFGLVRERIHLGVIVQYTFSESVEFDYYLLDSNLAIRPIAHQRVPLFERSPWRARIEMGYQF